MKKIIILDFSDGQVWIRRYDEEAWNDPEEFISSLGFYVKNCQWMLINELNLNIQC